MQYDSIFPAFPNESQCWVYALDQIPSEQEEKTILADLSAFLKSWTSHSRPVQGAVSLLEGRFLVVIGKLQQGDISGCGIDSSVHQVEKIVAQVNRKILSPLLVYFCDQDNVVQAVPRPVFRRLVREQVVDENTMVFDLNISTLGELRERAFQKRAGDSWHNRIFRISQLAPQS